jgi:protein phosphatase-4 regulatory subunit 3
MMTYSWTSLASSNVSCRSVDSPVPSADVAYAQTDDPNFPTMKAAYRAHLSDPSLYVEVVPIPDEATKQKIHQIYRLQYIKDVILPRALDDGAFQIINSFIYFNQVDIVQYLSANEDFWKEIFQGTFPEQLPNGTGADDDKAKEAKPANGDGTHHTEETADRQQDAIAFLQSYAQTVKQLQPNMRTATFRSLSERGLLRILEYALSNTRLHDVQHVRVAVVEIIMLLVDNDPNSIRGFVLKEHETAGKQGTLLLALIKAFHKEEELGIKAQLAESIRVLLLPPGEASATEVSVARL